MTLGRGRQYMSIAVAALALVIALIAVPAIHFTNSIIDVSWPNCHQAATYGQQGIVGVTGGLDFKPNPCLSQEFSQFDQAALYMNTGYPDTAHANRFTTKPRRCKGRDTSCLAYNYGYNASLYAIDYANNSGVHSNLWWLDVETENSWSTSTTLNQAALQGAIDALRQTVPFVKVGMYSDKTQWSELTGGWRNHLPTWVATGSTQSAAARLACQQPSFTAGTNWLAQYTPAALDINYPCNGLLMKYLL